MKFTNIALATLLAASATAVAAQDAPAAPFKVTGSVGLVSDYRFRGVSQTDEEMAIQGGFTVAHESGFYVATWGSNLSGWGTFGGANMELDLVAGYSHPVGGGTLDVGLTWYMYPGGFSNTDFAEPYAKLTGTAGPVSLTAGVAYAPKQEALGNWSNTPSSAVGDKEDNLYLWGDAGMGIAGTPISLKGHIGYSDGNPGLGPNGTSLAPTGKYWDWLLGVSYVVGPVTLGVAYTDTDISKSESAYIQPNFSNTKDGSTIAGAQVVFSITAGF